MIIEILGSVMVYNTCVKMHEKISDVLSLEVISD